MERNNDDTNPDIPFWKRYAFTIEEAAEFYLIGQAKLRSIVEYEPNADFIIYNGNRVLIKKVQFEKYLDSCTTI